MEKKSKFFIGAMTALVLFSGYVLADSFLISRVYSMDLGLSTETGREELSSGVETGTEELSSGVETGTEELSSGEAGQEEREEVLAESEGEGDLEGKVSIRLTEYEVDGTRVYVADVFLSSPSDLQTALADGAYGKNIKAATSEIAEEVGATLAVNGDFYGARERGYVIRNGILYRNTAVEGQEDLVIYEDGRMEIIREEDISAEELLDQGAVQVFSFGPGLVEGGEVLVDAQDEVGKAKASNPRTAIGRVDGLHYVLVVSDGRTQESAGLSLLQLADFMKEELGVETAYNLDGGGSSTMYYQGEVVNQPTTGGNKIKERSVSDIVYIKSVV